MKPANPSPHAAAEEEKESVKLEKPNEHDVEYTMDSEPDLADEPDDDELDIPNADEDPEKLAEPGAFRMLPQLAPHLAGCRAAPGKNATTRSPINYLDHLLSYRNQPNSHLIKIT